MTEQYPQSFPLPNPVELVCIHTRAELEKAGIILQEINIDIVNKTCSVTTDKKVPEAIMSDIREYAQSKGITVQFLSTE
jgi:hypothetical protein